MRYFLKILPPYLKKLSTGIVKTDTHACLQVYEPIMNKNKEVRKPRYDGRTKKRQWEERRSDKGEGLDPTLPKLQKVIDKIPASEKTLADKIKRRKYAILLGYLGTDYYGMQRNPHTKTIEEDLFKALLKANFISQDCYNQVQNMQFQRAARTDKGVSAARQVVSLKLGENFDIGKVNVELPETIRLFSHKRVTKGFNSKSQCDARTYIYLMPTIAFAKKDSETLQRNFRLDGETFKKINDLLRMYLGTKNYHNFTAKKKPQDPSSKRVIKSFECEAPFIKDDVEFCILKVCGQSFMMHQIRKMIGLIVSIVRGQTSENIVNLALSMEKVNIPRVPGLGLILDQVHYNYYNSRYGSDGMHEKLTWEDAEPEVKEFKEKYIFPTIITTEIEHESMVDWLTSKLRKHSFTETEEKDGNDSDEDAEDDNDNEEKVQKNNV
ncbi:pseudouridylate synthase 1 homolog [Cylas formicarius]|uniref:pseudouridylate synthase 1 homolog n=1 Tax=Cylas formicarius TaxID=197179 RepID=UPI0029589E98|nr:pseudouridylate synthase 1 homolog [Cylas formicarius]